jgi:hypothetical protein
MFKILKFFVFFLYSSMYLQAQTDSVKLIYSHYIEAIGGQEKLDEIKIIKQQGKNNFNGMKTDFKEYHLRPSMVRTEVYSDKYPSVVITCMYQDSMLIWDKKIGNTPVHTWQASEMVTGKKSVHKKNLDKSYFYNSLVEYQFYNYPIKYLGKTIKLGKETFMIQVEIDKFTKNVYYLDCKTYYLIAKDSESALSNVIKSESYEDYKEVGGILIASKIRSSVNGEYTSIKEYESIETNIPIDPRLLNCVPLPENTDNKKD